MATIGLFKHETQNSIDFAFFAKVCPSVMGRADGLSRQTNTGRPSTIA